MRKSKIQASRSVKTGPSLKLAYGHPTENSSHQHQDIEINWVFEGELHYFLNGSYQSIRKNEAGVFWAGYPHAVISYSSPTTVLWITLPLHTFLQWSAGKSLAAQILKGSLFRFRPQDAKNATLNQLQLRRWFEELDPTHPQTEQVILLELEAWLTRASWNRQASRSPSIANTTDTTRVEQITHFIHSHYQENLSVGEIAQHLHLHPKYLMQIFKSTVHLSIYQYIMQLRLAHAQRLLLSTQRKVIDIALEVGFGSTRQFYQAFQKKCSISPGQYRRRYHDNTK